MKRRKPDLSKLSEEQQKNYQERSSWLTQRQLCQYLLDEGKQCKFYLFEGKGHGGSIPDAINIALEKVQNKQKYLFIFSYPIGR